MAELEFDPDAHGGKNTLEHLISKKPQVDRPAAASTAGLADQMELAAAAFTRTRMPMVVVDARDPELPIAMANAAFLELTGYIADEVVGRNCRFLQGPDTSAGTVREISSAVASGSEVSVEILNYRKDGRQFWSQLYLSPIHDDDDKLLYYFGSQLDVTALRKVQSLEASESRLLREVDHRAKNVLALVNSIVRLSRSSDPEKYAASVQHRVEALADAHGLLAERRWQSVPLGQLLDRQIAQFKTPAVSMGGPEIPVPTLLVQPVALVVHELIANAKAHGALSTPVGKLRIDWQKLDGGFQIKWLESDGAKPAPDAKPGFGSIIMNVIIEKQLGGAVRRVWTADGLDLALDVPAN